MSPVCRAVLLLLKSNEVPYEEVFIDLSKGERPQPGGSMKERTAACIHLRVLYFFFFLQLGEEDTNELLGAINPNRRVPTMDDNGFGLFERYSLSKCC